MNNFDGQPTYDRSSDIVPHLYTNERDRDSDDPASFFELRDGPARFQRYAEKTGPDNRGNYGELRFCFPVRLNNA